MQSNKWNKQISSYICVLVPTFISMSMCQWPKDKAKKQKAIV